MQPLSNLPTSSWKNVSVPAIPPRMHWPCVFVCNPSQEAQTTTGLQGKKGQGPPGTPKGLIKLKQPPGEGSSGQLNSGHLTKALNTRQLKKGHKTYTCNG